MAAAMLTPARQAPFARSDVRIDAIRLGKNGQRQIVGRFYLGTAENHDLYPKLLIFYLISSILQCLQQ